MEEEGVTQAEVDELVIFLKQNGAKTNKQIKRESKSGDVNTECTADDMPTPIMANRRKPNRSEGLEGMGQSQACCDPKGNCILF